jgi:hypothetical protein
VVAVVVVLTQALEAAAVVAEPVVSVQVQDLLSLADSHTPLRLVLAVLVGLPEPLRVLLAIALRLALSHLLVVV